MKKRSESPLQHQAQKRFLGQITGLEADQPDDSNSKSGLQKFFSNLKNLF